MRRLELLGVDGLPEIRPGDDLARMLAERAQLQGGDVLVIAQKIVSKAEGRLRDLGTITPSERALAYAERMGGDPRLVQAVLDESTRVVRAERVLIAETRHGFVCANAGVDHSNLPGDQVVCLLPVDPDGSAAALRRGLLALTGHQVGVVVSDTFGRAWRLGIANVALGVAGLPALLDYRGRPDDFGKPLRMSVIAVADELAAAAELVMGKSSRVPAVVVRGWRPEGPVGTGRDLLRPPQLDLFR